MKILIIEDEAAAARRLKKLLLEVNPKIEIIGHTDSIESTLNWLHINTMPDIFLMDIHLADGSSFEIFNHVQIPKPVIFTTAFDQYAIQAFKVNAVDYLLKPIKKLQLEQALERYQQRVANKEVNYKALARAIRNNDDRKRFLIKIGQQLKIISIKDAAYFYTKDKVTFLITFEGKRFPIDHSLEKVEEMTDPNQFFRINRQFILNIEAIKQMHAYSKSRVKIELQPPCEIDTIVSTERSPHFKKWLLGE
jgi:two-component system LytT family response regulator